MKIGFDVDGVLKKYLVVVSYNYVNLRKSNKIVLIYAFRKVYYRKRNLHKISVMVY